jgi:hypothetical protein
VAKTPVFISFDYDHDLDLYNLLLGQSKNEDSPFEITNWSVKDASPNWVQDARGRIARVNQVIVMCGLYTGSALGIDTEIGLARELGKPYFLLAGRSAGANKKPRAALAADQMYTWTWPNLKTLIAGGR